MRGLVILFIFFILCSAVPAHSEGPSGKTSSSYNQLILSGEIIAEEISKATGFAISPILGISVLGAYTYYTTPVEKRDRVPWHAKPPFWVPLLVVLAGIILKDSSKIALPKIIIMPLDAIETLLEKNVSAVLGLLVILSSITGKGIEQLQLGDHGTALFLTATAHASEGVNSAAAAASSGFIEMGFLSILLTGVFGLVWVVSQAFNFLIFLSPSSWLDLMLTGCKNFLVALLLGACLINPYLGLFLSGIIIIISLFLFARSYRFVIFGTIFSSDVVLRKSKKHRITSGRIRAFAGSTLADVPSLSYGVLTAENAKLVFQYRPWLFMPARSITTAWRCDLCEAGIGTLSPVIITQRGRRDSFETLFRLRPLYHSHENQVAELLGLKGVRDVTFGKTLRDGYRWLLEQVGIAAKSEPETT
jgi:hypothetical protein